MKIVILGVDPGVHRLGLAACTLTHGEPVWSGAHPITTPTGGHPHQQIGAALTWATTTRKLEPVIVAIEDPTHASRGKRQASQWGGIIALLEAESRRRWPHAPVWTVPPTRWKKEIGLAGNAGRDDYLDHAERLGYATGSDHDVAAAACIATWAWRTNQRGLTA